MIYRKFGKTGLSMPVLSCGLMRSMFSWQDTPLAQIPIGQQERLAAVVDAAISCGINHFETARGYGSSERQLAEIFTRYKRSSLIVQTKVSPEDDPARFVANVEDSLNRLGLKRVDLLTLHGINDHHSLWQSCRPGGCLAAARELQKKGKAGWIGFSGHGELQVILAAINHRQDRGFDYLNLHWYAVWQHNRPALEAAAEHDMGVFIISPTDKGGMLQAPSRKISALCKPLLPIQFNDLFCLQKNEIHTISIGASCPQDFLAHLEALSLLENSKPVDTVYNKWTCAMHKATGFSRPDALWDRLPRWQETPGYINIPLILWLYNLAQGWELVEYGKLRYQKLGKNMPWVPGNDADCIEKYDLADIANKAEISQDVLKEMLGKAHSLFGTS